MLGVENMTGLPAGLHKLRLAAAYDARFRHLSLELQWTWAFLGILDPGGPGAAWCLHVRGPAAVNCIASRGDPHWTLQRKMAQRLHEPLPWQSSSQHVLVGLACPSPPACPGQPGPARPSPPARWGVPNPARPAWLGPRAAQPGPAQWPSFRQEANPRMQTQWQTQ